MVVKIPEPTKDRSTPYYNVKEYKLDSARTNVKVEIAGDRISAWTNGTLIGSAINIDSISEDSIPLDKFNSISIPSGFKRFYLTTSAQAGKSLFLFIGRTVGAGLGQLPTNVASTAVTTPVSFTAIETLFYTLSDKDTHFTGALAQYAAENENLTGLITNNIMVTGVELQSDQQLIYKLLFWGKDTFNNADLDIDVFSGDIDLDLTTEGFQIGGANQYYMSVNNFLLPYMDLDSTNELHVSLMNMSAGAKNAGATGEVVLKIYYIPRN